ncbi:MAG: DUF1508 domain-containing protein, partial [Gammaproteobacteria bacterium]|nr:DUF1508 domain-containing protein [Gammaproteobacteria bacterium]
MRADLLDGLAWGEAKQRLFEQLNAELSEPRERYHQLISKPHELEEILQAGAAKARKIATPFMAQLRDAVGLRSFSQVQVAEPISKKKAKKTPRIVSFRDEQGFRFRVLDAQGVAVLLSVVFADGRSAGQALKALQAGEADLLVVEQQVQALQAGELIAQSESYASVAQAEQALTSVQQAMAAD